MAIEVFELAENEDALSPVDMEPEKLVHKFKEVGRGGEGRSLGWWRAKAGHYPSQQHGQLQPELSVCLSAPTAPDQARCD